MSNPRDDLIEDYLDHACAPLVGVVPYARRMRLRGELREHMELVLEDTGDLTAALRELGEPWEAGTRFVREWEAEQVGRGLRYIANSPFGAAIGYLGTVIGIAELTSEVVRGYPPASSLGFLPKALEWLIPVAAWAYGRKYPSHVRSALFSTIGLSGYVFIVGRDPAMALRLLTVWSAAVAIVSFGSGCVARQRRRSRFLGQHVTTQPSALSIPPAILLHREIP